MRRMVRIGMLLLAVGVLGCEIPPSSVTPPRETARAELGDLGSEWHERDLAIAQRQPTPGCYGSGRIGGMVCACQFVCGAGWHLDAVHDVWQPTAADCNCASSAEGST